MRILAPRLAHRDLEVLDHQHRRATRTPDAPINNLLAAAGVKSYNGYLLSAREVNVDSTPSAWRATMKSTKHTSN